LSVVFGLSICTATVNNSGVGNENILPRFFWGGEGEEVENGISNKELGLLVVA